MVARRIAIVVVVAVVVVSVVMSVVVRGCVMVPIAVHDLAPVVVVVLAFVVRCGRNFCRRMNGVEPLHNCRRVWDATGAARRDQHDHHDQRQYKVVSVVSNHLVTMLNALCI